MGLRTQLVHSDGLEGGQDTPCQIIRAGTGMVSESFFARTDRRMPVK